MPWHLVQVRRGYVYAESTRGHPGEIPAEPLTKFFEELLEKFQMKSLVRHQKQLYEHFMLELITESLDASIINSESLECFLSSLRFI